METSQTASHAILAGLLDQFSSLFLAVLIKRDWKNVPALYSAISGSFAAIEDFRSECGMAENLTGSIYSSPALPVDERFRQFVAALQHYSDVFYREAAALGSLAGPSARRTIQPFRTDDELITYLRQMESDARRGITLLRQAVLVVDALAEGKTLGVLIDIKV
jgi:hypothetical protein